MALPPPVQSLPGLVGDTRALLEVINSLRAEIALLQAERGVTALQTRDYAAKEGERVRIKAGLKLTLPRARLQNQGARISAMVEGDGSITVAAEQSTVNEQTAVRSGRRLIIFESNGNGNWASSEDLDADLETIADAAGSAGATGATGSQGIQGTPGRDGRQGVQGYPGMSGAPGLPGPQGPPGAGFRGQQGYPGPPGAPGASGIPGLQGPPGRDGKQGPQGYPGCPGQRGPQGIQGPPGREGRQGPPGPPGRDSGRGVIVEDGNTVVHQDAKILNFAASIEARDAGNGQVDIDYVGTTSVIENTTATGNLGTIDISTLKCGGAYRVSAASSSFSIEGWSGNNTDGFWFVFSWEEAGGSSDSCTLFHEDATASAANRLAMPQEDDILNARTLYGIFFYAGSRWRWLSCDPRRIGTSTLGVEVTASQISMATPASDINISAGGNVNVTGTTNVNVVSGEDIILEHEGADHVVVQATDDSGGFLVIEEGSSSAPTVAAGHGALWMRNDATPAVTPMFTGDDNVDHDIVCTGPNNTQTVTGATGNLGTIDISGLRCGGVLIIGSTATGAHQIEGFTAKPDGFFFFIVSNTTQTTQFLTEDATATAANRIRVNGNVDTTALAYGHAMAIYASSRWRLINKA